MCSHGRSPRPNGKKLDLGQKRKIYFSLKIAQRAVVQFIKEKKLEHGLTFHASVLKKKIITTGDGGMICLNDKEKYEKIKSLSFHGWNIDPWKRHQMFFKKKINFPNIGDMK